MRSRTRSAKRWPRSRRTALATLATDGVPERIVARIAAYVDEVRRGARPEPTSQDVRLGIGVLWGEQVRAQVGWRWVHLSYANGFASYALVPDDRAFACFPLNRLGELMREERTARTPPRRCSIRSEWARCRAGKRTRTW